MLNHTGTVPLHTQRLVLRRFTLEDADAMYANWASDERVTRYLLWETHANRDVSADILRLWIDSYEKPGVYNWGIEFRGTLIGGISVVNADSADEWAEIGYAIGHAYWDQGIMTEALRAVLDHMFLTIGLHRVTLRHDVENIGSGRVMQKNGLVHEGTARKEHRRKDGTWADLAHYSILREEWLALREDD